MKNFKENFNFLTNIFILILLFFGGLSYADTNGIWQFANDTRPGVFGLDEGAGIGNNYTFINPVYFNLGLTSTGFTRILELHSNLLYANNVTIASQLTLSGFNCGINSKLRTDAFGNVVCSQDNINDSVHNLATMKTAVSYDFHNLGGIDKDTWITTQACGIGLILKSVGKNSKICIPLKWAAVTGKPIPRNCKSGFYMSNINIGGGTIGCKKLPTQGITTEVDPKVGSLQAGKWCTSNGATVNCTSAAPSSGGSTIVPAIKGAAIPRTGSGQCRGGGGFKWSCPTGFSPLVFKSYRVGSGRCGRHTKKTIEFCYK